MSITNLMQENYRLTKRWSTHGRDKGGTFTQDPLNQRQRLDSAMAATQKHRKVTRWPSLVPQQETLIYIRGTFRTMEGKALTINPKRAQEANESAWIHIMR